MNTTGPDSLLDEMDERFHQLAMAVALGETESLAMCSEQLQHLAAEVAAQWQQPNAAYASQRQRVRALQEGLQVVRTGLLRRAHLVEQALNLVVPATVEPTYAGSATYGSGPKASGRWIPVSA
nr:hypothetical protein [uncultured Rhodoferax sp.]